MNLLEFIIFFTLLIPISSFFIVSFYDITRHYIVIQPDGKEKIEGDLLKYWSVFWDKIKRIDKKYYSGGSLEYKLSELKRLLPPIGNKFEIVPEKTSLLLLSEQTTTADEQERMKAVLTCTIEVNGDYFFLYLEEPIYYIPDILRKPFNGCVRCMANPFGSAIWLSINYLYNPFSWTNHKIFAFFFFYMIFLITLVKVNSIIFKRTF